MDMARRRVDLRLDEELLARLDAEAERLGQTRTKFVERALESALGERPSAGHPAKSREVAGSIPATPAPSRAPVPGVVRASSLSKQGVKPRPKLK